MSLRGFAMERALHHGMKAEPQYKLTSEVVNSERTSRLAKRARRGMVYSSSWMVLLQLASLLLAVQSFTPTPVDFSRSSYARGVEYQATAKPMMRYRHETMRLMASPSQGDEVFVEAEDLEALQALFNRYCDDDGLITREKVMEVPAIADLLSKEDLMLEEFDEIWNEAPKFPDDSNRLDVDSFVQVYRDIDDIFEDDDEESDEVSDKDDDAEARSASRDDGDDTQEEAELEHIFETLCDGSKLISRTTLREWDEVSTLLEDGMLGEDEFDSLWDKTQKSPGSPDQLDVDGFLSFNVALDALFEFDDYEMADGDDKDVSDAETVPPPQPAAPTTANLPMVEGDDLEPEVLFELLVTSDGLMGKNEINRWRELREMLADGEILPEELRQIFDGIPKANSEGTKIDKDGFIQFYKAIDELFEDADEEDDSGTEQGSNRKAELYAVLEEINDDPEMLSCGLECSEQEQRAIQGLVKEIESGPGNLVRTKQGAIELSDLAGTWELLYSSSSAMSYNKGLSGLAGSLPNAKFGGIKQTLSVSRVTSDLEYLERINLTPASASFDVRVTGDWGLRTSVSLFTGEPSTVLTVVPDMVFYGPSTTRADHWKTLGPLNMLDVTYLDDDLRIMRGNTSTDTIFVFRRSEQQKK